MMRIHSQPCGFFLVLLQCFVSGVLALQNGGEYQCSPWKDGEKVTVTFRIDRSKFPTLCDLSTVNGKPLFSMSTDSGANYITNCTLENDIRSQGSCNLSPGTPGCDCTSETDNNYFVIEYNFIAGPDYGKWWQPSVNCLDSNYDEVFSFTGTDCQPIPEVSTTPATTTETTEQTTHSSDTSTGNVTSVVIPASSSKPAVSNTSQNPATTAGTEQNTTSTNDSPHKYVAVYVGVGFVVLIVIIACVVVLVLRKRGAKTDTDNRDRLANGGTIPNDRTFHRHDTRM